MPKQALRSGLSDCLDHEAAAIPCEDTPFAAVTKVDLEHPEYNIHSKDMIADLIHSIDIGGPQHLASPPNQGNVETFTWDNIV